VFIFPLFTVRIWTKKDLQFLMPEKPFISGLQQLKQLKHLQQIPPEKLFGWCHHQFLTFQIFINHFY
jgi:hypothetical protein